MAKFGKCEKLHLETVNVINDSSHVFINVYRRFFFIKKRFLTF